MLAKLDLIFKNPSSKLVVARGWGAVNEIGMTIKGQNEGLSWFRNCFVS